MPYCPQCKYEFPADEMMCPDCQVALIEKPGYKGSAAVVPDDSWVVVGSVDNDSDKRAVQGSLDSRNIPSMILPPSFDPVGRGMISGTGRDAGSLNGSLVVVPREFQEDATVLLKGVLGGDFWGEDHDENAIG